jgi:glycosidase
VNDWIIYEIFPDRFYDGDIKNDPSYVRRWNERPGRNSFFGGDLKGIIRKIDYIKSLGFNAIYLTPIFESPSPHKYDTKNFFKIDPNFGDEKTFEALIDNAHNNGIKVIIDGVFNHTGLKFWAFKDIQKKGKNSNFLDWYYINDLPLKTRPKPNYIDAGIYYIPKLNNSNQKVISYMKKVVGFWTRKGIDGWRFDMPWCINVRFFNELIEVIRKINPNIYTIGESWEKPDKLLYRYPFDGSMDYIFRKNTISLLNKRISPDNYFRSINYKFDDKFRLCWNMLGSHDTSRLLGKLHRNTQKTILAFVLQFTLPGIPLVYYGDEIGMYGGKDPDNRRPFIWNKKRWNLEIIDSIRKLTEIRKKHSDVFTRGKCLIEDQHYDGFRFCRTKDSKKIEVEIDLKLFSHNIYCTTNNSKENNT